MKEINFLKIKLQLINQKNEKILSIEKYNN